MAKHVKVFLGRFQPFHSGHLKVLRAAIDTADHVVVLIGSINAAQSLKNPWSYFEREGMIRHALRPGELAKITILPISDVPGDDKAWVANVRQEVTYAARCALPRGKIHYTLVGCHKGADTYYLKLYKNWGKDLISSSETLNATDIRRAYFGRQTDWAKNLPPTSAMFLWAWFIYNGSSFMRFRLDLLEEERQRQ